MTASAGLASTYSVELRSEMAGDGKVTQQTGGNRFGTPKVRRKYAVRRPSTTIEEGRTNPAEKARLWKSALQVHTFEVCVHAKTGKQAEIHCNLPNRHLLRRIDFPIRVSAMMLARACSAHNHGAHNFRLIGRMFFPRIHPRPRRCERSACGISALWLQT